MKSYLAVLLLTVVTLVGCAKPVQPPYAEDPWVREPPPGAGMLAGYLILHNPSGQDLVLTGASSPDFAAVEFHHSMVENGTMSMRQEVNLPIPDGQTLAFTPGARHLMLIAPKRELAAGDQVLIELKFADGSQLHFTAPVRSNDDGNGH